VRTVPDLNGLVAATNHFQHPTMAELQTGWLIPSSVNRLRRIHEMFGSGCHGIAEAQAALVDLCPPAGADDVWDCLNNPGTIYSSVTDPAALKLWVRAHDRPDRTWVELDFSDTLAAARSAA
jgi:hypothetical protein